MDEEQASIRSLLPGLKIRKTISRMTLPALRKKLDMEAKKGAQQVKFGGTQMSLEFAESTYQQAHVATSNEGVGAMNGDSLDDVRTEALIDSSRGCDADHHAPFISSVRSNSSTLASVAAPEEIERIAALSDSYPELSSDDTSSTEAHEECETTHSPEASDKMAKKRKKPAVPVGSRTSTYGLAHYEIERLQLTDYGEDDGVKFDEVRQEIRIAHAACTGVGVPVYGAPRVPLGQRLPKRQKTVLNKDNGDEQRAEYSPTTSVPLQSPRTNSARMSDELIAALKGLSL